MKTLIFSAILLLTNLASASYLETCILGGTVDSVEAIQLAQNDETFAHRMVTFTIKTAQEIPGSHSDCQHHLNTSKTVDLKTVALQDIALLQMGSYVSVDYFYVNSFGPSGVVESTNAQVNSMSLVAYNAAMSNKGVGEAILRTQRLLGEGAEFKLGKVQELPSYCGFAGCTNDYIVMLTYGINDTSSPRATVVVSLHIEALGEVSGIQVIQDPSMMMAF